MFRIFSALASILNLDTEPWTGGNSTLLIEMGNNELKVLEVEHC